MLTNLFRTETKKDDFSQKMKYLIQYFSDKKIVIFGLGEETKILLNKYNLKKLNIVGVSDNKQPEWQPENIKFIEPQNINSVDFEYILIAQDNLLRAKSFLINDMKADPNKIIRIIEFDVYDDEINLKYLNKINFSKQLQQLSQKLSDKKIVIYGANSFLKTINKHFDIKQLNILAISDINFKMAKNGETFLGYEACSAYNIKQYKPDYVVVAEKFLTNEIIELLSYTSLKNIDTKIIPIFKKPLLTGIYNAFTSRNTYLPIKPNYETKIKRLKNYLSTRFNEKVKFNTYKDYEIPSAIRIEACTLCQLNCSSCYMRKYNHDAIGDGWLKFENFKNMIDKNPNIKEASISNSGEIFLNPELIDILRYASEKGIKLNALTGVNLNTLSDEMAEALVKYRFDFLNLSIDGASQETYVQYRKNGNFNKVINNIKKINEYKKKYNSIYPKMKWKFILFNHNEHEIVKAKEMSKELKVDISFELPWGDKTFTPKNPEFVKKETGIKFASVTESQTKTKKKRTLNLCKRTFTAPQFNYDGTLLGCCILFREHYGINAFETGFETSLQSAEFQYSIRMLRGELPPILSNPCTSCNEYNSMTYNKSYFL